MNCPGAAARRNSIVGAALVDQLGLLDHHHAVGAARQHAAGRDGGGGAGRNLERRRMAAGDHFGVELEKFRIGVAGADDIGGAQREAVDIGAVERRRIDRRHHVVAPARAPAYRQAARVSAASGAKIEMPLKAGARFFRRHHFKELLLARGRTHARNQVGVFVPRLAGFTHLAVLVMSCYGQGLTQTSAPSA